MYLEQAEHVLRGGQLPNVRLTEAHFPRFEFTEKTPEGEETTVHVLMRRDVTDMLARRDSENNDSECVWQALRARLWADTIALSVLDSYLQDHTPAQTRRILKMDAKVYNAARKRIYRALKEVKPEL